MTTEQQLSHFEKKVDEIRRMLKSKGDDYSQGDRLSNFKQVGALLDIPPAKVALTLMAVKIQRESNLLAPGKTPNFEGIRDTSLDLIVYAFLNDMVLEETVTPPAAK